MYVCDDGKVFIETFNPVYDKLRNFLISCAEPQCRTEFIQEYQITASSVAAAAAEGVYSEEDIRLILKEYGTSNSGTSPVMEKLMEKLKEERSGRKRSRDEDDQDSNAAPTQPSTATKADVVGEENDGDDTIQLFVPEADAEQPPTQQSRGWVPPLVDRLLDDSANSQRLRLVLQRRHGYAFEERKAPSRLRGAELKRGKESIHNIDGHLAFYLVSTTEKLLVDVVRSSDSLQAALVPLHSRGDEKEGVKSMFSASNYIFSDVEEYEISLAASAEKLERAALAMLEGEEKKKQKASNHDERGHDAELMAGRSTVLSQRTVYKVEVRYGCLRALREEVQNKLGLHIDCSYDHSTDKLTPRVPNFALKPNTKLRPYQEASLERFQTAGRVRNGVVVLPCGAGKTLTGIAASRVIGRPVIVMCINVQSVLQWRAEFLKWTELKEEQVTICTSDQKQTPGDIFITTYAMMIKGNNDNSPTDPNTPGLSDEIRRRLEILQQVTSRSWGLLLLDEVHTALAKNYQTVIDRVRAHCILGLTATLLRQDGRIDDLRFLVGPKLFEANWLELASAGYLAQVICAEIRCPLPLEFLTYYQSIQTTNIKLNAQIRNTFDDDDGGTNAKSQRASRKDIECMNPYKLWCTQALIHYHCGVRHPSDKVLIFCDSTIAIRYYAHRLGIPFMDGMTTHEERNSLLDHFKKSPRVNALLLSRVGDTALDLPEANVVIEVDSFGGSSRQEAQRLGRILRPKPPSVDSSVATFYALVSLNTEEEKFMFPRQQWLRNQGFEYRSLDAVDVIGAFAPSSHALCRSLSGRSVSSPSVGASRFHPVCIGRPVWSLFAHPEIDPILAAYGWPTSTSLPKKGKGQRTAKGDGENLSAGCWVDFEPDASAEIEKAFIRGRATASIRARTPTSAHGGKSHSSGFVGKVQFQLPQGQERVVGTVDPLEPVGLLELTIPDRSNKSDGKAIAKDDAPQVDLSVSTKVRRCSKAGGEHECGKNCLEYALSMMGEREKGQQQRRPAK